VQRVLAQFDDRKPIIGLTRGGGFGDPGRRRRKKQANASLKESCHLLHP